MNALLKILAIALSLSFSTYAMNDIGFMKMLTVRASAKEIPQKMSQLVELKDRGAKLGLIIGRGNLETGHAALPGEEDGSIIWVYTNVDRGLLGEVSGKPSIWMDFDNVEQLAKLESDFFSHIYFDWSVIRFFNNVEKVITELKRICVNGGEIFVPAGEQHGMASFYPVETQIEERPFPLKAFYSMNNVGETFTRMSALQEVFLKSVFGDDNVKLVKSEIYPPAPEKKNNLNNYFVVTK